MASPSHKVEVALKNACAILGEGPHWDSNTGTLLFVDIMAMEVHRWTPDTNQHQVKKLNQPVGHVVPRAKGGCVVGLGQSFAALQWDSDDVQKTPDLEGGVSTFRFNDGKCDAKGRLWGGTLSQDVSAPVDKMFDVGVGSLYRLDTDWTVNKQHTGLTISNGLAWTADNSVMFLVDSAPKKLSAFDFDLESGTMKNQRTVVTLPADTGMGEASPDGMTIDVNDKLWIACWDGRAVIQLDPETGKLLRKVDIPAKNPSSVCWGGPHLDEMYVTTARVQSPEELAKEPLNGSIFKVTGLGCKGHPAVSFQG